MNIKYLLTHSVSVLLLLALFVSCSEDDNGTGTEVNPPSVTAPGSQNTLVGESIEITFNITADEGYQSAEVTAQNGTAEITSEPEAGATSGDVVVNYTGDASGAGSVELTVTDADGMSQKATAVVSVNEEESTIRVVDNITEDTTWENGKIYILGGRIIVEPGATLTIEAGVIVKGEAGAEANATTLLVARDGTLNANGTAEQPIIFTSVADEITPEDVDNGNFASPNLDPTVRGLWGGVIVLGNAPISVGSGSEAQIEGIPSSETLALYGGDDAEDSSGSLTYVTIRHGGTNIGEGNEINGLSLGGVGSGTTIENIEIVANQDDGVEWFGGTVSVKNVLVWNNGDDALDTDQAWAGTVDNVVTINPAGSLMELDGPEGSYTGSGHTITNVTAYAGADTEFLIDTDDNTDVNVNNVLFMWSSESTTMLDDNYSEYADNQNGYAITSLEAVLPSGTLSDFFPSSLIDAEEVSSVSSYSEATVGADVSVFGFTWASQSGALAEIGLE
ncbi:hypothetical protein NC796_05330 [Aliifodinibius sp. S!AR15-10]|uniref:hypothetical protein n=1 Tax=Aliifodinibius sp. S!AR15-10 TaxID=2950437 RepID=UPI002864A0BE|nr:hypothetical protein [Aliifodinibius sp. S!AR15-10]MDR8390553.1 hypothetical protein [Aliifodinibius sp. S!AR15-10]